MILALAALSATLAVEPQALWDAWPQRRFVQAPAGCLRPADLTAALQSLAAKHAGRARLEEIGRSVEGRPIHLLTVGTGERRVLLWSQMHGDEPSATPALLDLADHLLTGPEGRPVLDALTLLMVPMLNPDGAERVARRNAQGIDVNRDALSLATPEGRLLKEIRDRHRPLLGFNLHDQDRRTTVGDTGRLATIALLGVAGDPQGTMTEGRARAKRAASAIVSALRPLIGESVARYDEDWSPRAFGDNVTAWGTPVVLVESGGYAGPLTDLTRLNFVALASVLAGLAADDLAGHDPALYESLARNREDAYADVIVRGGRVLQGAGGPYRADLAFDVRIPDRRAWACDGVADSGPSRIVEVGDARFLAAGRVVDASGALIVPALAASVRGLAARRWLTAAALDAMAGLGVAEVRWHVRRVDVGAALDVADALAAAGRPAIRVARLLDPPAGLVIARPPRRPASRTLADVLDALGTWRTPARPLASAPSSAPPASSPPPVPLTRDAPASFLVLRLPEGAPPDPATLRLDAVFVDGRERP
jgi:hypothetical protein